ncbi:MAG TPA: hypothetical protein VGC53_12040 [Vicinamibacteria bacterium]|jgi:hypothetical protein
MKDNTLSRREFTRESVLALLSGVVITITGCGGSDGYSTSPTPPPMGGGRNGNISGNHGHAAFVSDAQISAANNIRVDIMGNADHGHTIDLTGGELMQIGNGQRIVKTSTVSQVQGTHSHNVTFN